MTCTITNNDDPAALTVVKRIVNDDGGTAVVGDFDINTDATVAAEETFGAGVADGANTLKYSTAKITGLSAGSYSLTEIDLAGYTEGSWSCTGGTGLVNTYNAGSITLANGADVTCTITNNDIAPKLKLVKVVVLGTNPWSTAVANDWALTADAAGTSLDGRNKNSVAGGSDTLTIAYANVAYALSETGPAGFDASSWDCEDSGGDYAGQSGSSVTLGLADEVTCTITNTARGMVDLTKYFNGALVTDQTFDFTLSGPDIGGPLSDSTPPNPVDFDGAKLKVGETYTICEINIGAGATSHWEIDTTEPPDGVGDTNLPFVGGTDDLSGNGLNQVYNPDDDGSSSSEDLGTRCVNFQVGIGETVNFVVDNRTPLGDARTPGYWKNWSSCSNGNQFAKAAYEYEADPSGLIDMRHYTLDEILTEAYPGLAPIHAYDLGVKIGLINIDGDTSGNAYDQFLTSGAPSDADCETAVLVLNSSDHSAVKGGKGKPVNRSSDPAYKLGRYLLAYIANQTAGAYACDLADDAAAAAQSLLLSIGFDGKGAFLDKKSIQTGSGTVADAENALYYHGILGQYVENDPFLDCDGPLSPPNP